MTLSGPDQEWVHQHTVENDTLASLAEAYGVSAKEICSQNGVPFTTADIQRWVKAHNGKVLPYDSSSHPFPNSKEGWAVFTSRSEIRLPKIQRKDGKGFASITDARGGPMMANMFGSVPGIVMVVGLVVAGFVILPKLKKSRANNRRRQTVLSGYFK